MTMYQVLDTDKVMTEDEIAQFIVSESKRVAKKYSLNYGTDRDEMESFMVSEIYNEIVRKPEFGNIKGIRYIANLRSVDFIREQIDLNNEMSFTSLTSTHHNAEDCDIFEYGWEDRKVEPQEEFLHTSKINNFLDSLSEKERKLIELSAGITDNLSHDEKVNVKKIIDKKGTGSSLSDTEIGQVLGLTRRQVQYPFLSGKFKKKALRSGLGF